MKILLTTDAVGGVWDYATTLHARLLEHGHEVLLASLGDPGPDRLQMLPPGARWTSGRFELEWTEGGLDDVEPAARWIGKLADTMGADLVHLNQLAYAHLISHPTVVVVHSDAWSWFSESQGAPPTGDPRWSAYRAVVARSLASADAVVTPSRYQAELTKRHYERSVDRVILNGIDQSNALTRPLALEQRDRAPSALVSLGRAWDPAKGHAILDEALARVTDPWVGYLAGDVEGPEGQRFEPARLRHLGRLPLHGVRKLLARSSVYVAPSLYEPFGLAPVEAAMAGCALVLSDIGSFRELWADDALYFPAGDADALAEVLDRLREDHRLREDLGARASRRAGARFDDRQMTARYVRLYTSLRRAGLDPGGLLDTVSSERSVAP